MALAKDLIAQYQMLGQAGPANQPLVLGIDIVDLEVEQEPLHRPAKGRRDRLVPGIDNGQLVVGRLRHTQADVPIGFKGELEPKVLDVEAGRLRDVVGAKDGIETGHGNLQLRLHGGLLTHYHPRRETYTPYVSYIQSVCISSGEVMATTGRTKAEQREATVKRLIAVARPLFAQLGYAETPTERIVAEAGVTRGALYHHFGSKEGLFSAVLDAVQWEVAGRVSAAAAQQTDPWDQLLAGSHAFLAAAADPDVQRIMLLDAPAVLGWETWRRFDATHAMRLLREALDKLQENGVINVESMEAATHLLSGAMNESALWIARSTDVAAALGESYNVLTQLLEGLRKPRRRCDMADNVF